MRGGNLGKGTMEQKRTRLPNYLALGAVVAVGWIALTLGAAFAA